MSEHTPWCRGLFNALTEGGLWGVPRSGLVFRRCGNGLVLDTAMPHEEGMPLSAEDLAAFQEDDYQLIKQQFEEAGITVTKETA